MSRLITILEDSLNVESTMIAALIGVSERTLTNTENLDRLKSLNNTVQIILEKGISRDIILNVLNEPILSDGQSLLDIIADDPNNELLKYAVETVVKQFT